MNLAEQPGRCMAYEFLIRKKVHFPFLQGRELITGKDHEQGYFRLHVNQHRSIETITCYTRQVSETITYLVVRCACFFQSLRKAVRNWWFTVLLMKPKCEHLNFKHSESLYLLLYSNFTLLNFRFRTFKVALFKVKTPSCHLVSFCTFFSCVTGA